MKTFKTGIIGLGTVSRTHRNALAQLDHVELTAVSDVKPEKKDELAEGVHFYQDYEEMLDQEQLDAVHICLLSVTDAAGEELAKRSLDRCMENLQELIRTSLRRGDIAARCSVSQYILMLPQANYENSCKVCDRIVRAFFRQYPHSPAKLHFTVQHLEPNT